MVGTEVVGPKIGAELQRKAVLAVLYALGGMLVYIAFPLSNGFTALRR